MSLSRSNLARFYAPPQEAQQLARRDVNIKLPALHPSQLEVERNMRRFNVMVMGRRWGKTLFSLAWLIHAMLRGYPVGYFVPRTMFFEEVWRDAVKTLAPIITDRNRSTKRISIITGGSIEFWTLHNTDDPGRSRKYKRVVIDEAGIIAPSRFEKQWNESILPTLADYEGEAIHAGTPKGTNHFYRLYNDAANNPDWARFHLPTTSNPYIRRSEIDLAQRNLSRDVFRQEFLAEFVTDFGSVFTGETIFYDEPPPLSRIATGCDFAYTSKSGDWTVFVRAGLTTTGQMAILNMWRGQVSATLWAPVLAEQTNPFAFIGGQEKGITDFLRTDYGINLLTKPATQDKRARATAVATAFNRGDVLLPADASWVNEFELELRGFTGTSNDEHDDIVDALAAAHYALLGTKPATVGTVRIGRR